MSFVRATLPSMATPPMKGKCPAHPAVFCRLNPSSMAYHCYKCDMTPGAPLHLLPAKNRTTKSYSSDGGSVFSERSRELSKALEDVFERREKILQMFETITAKRSHLKGANGMIVRSIFYCTDVYLRAGEWFSDKNEQQYFEAEDASDTENESDMRSVMSMDSSVKNFSLYQHFLKIVTAKKTK